jgi:two-component system, sensor histidine kinase and response regulator
LTDEIIDPSAFDRLLRIGGDSFLKQMIDLFLQDSSMKLESALSGSKAGDWNTVEQAVHSLKSSAGNIGATKLSQLSDEIENLIRTDSPQTVPGLLITYEIVFNQVIDKLTEFKEGLL